MLNTLFQKASKKAALLATKSKFIRNMIEKRQISMEFPTSLFIEPTNLCNLKCNMCPQSSVGLELSSPLTGEDKGEGEKKEYYHPHPGPLPSRERGNDERIVAEPIPKVERGFMDFDLYKNIIDESLKFGKRTTIFFHKDGEPLLHPRLSEMIEYAVSRKAAYQTHLSTNAMLLNGKVADDILKSGIDSIVINIDAATSETYKKIKKVSGLERVEENIKNFIEMKKKLNLIKPLIRVKLIPVKENLGEIELFKKKWNRLVDEVVISREFLWPWFSRDVGASSVHARSELSPPLMGGDKGEGDDSACSSWSILSQSKEHPHPDPLPSRERENAERIGIESFPIKRYPCISLWLALTINWDGTVSICCIDFYHRGVLGSLRDNSIEEFWKGKKLQEIRIAHLEGKFNTIPICSDCKGLWLRDTLGKGSEKWLRAKMVSHQGKS